MAEILELVVNQRLFDQLVVNRFHYLQSGTPAAVTPSFGLLFATGFAPATGSPPTFAAGTLAAWFRGSVSGSLQFHSAYARNLYVNTDFYELPYPVPVTGALTNNATSPAMSYGLFSNRVRTDIRRGMKRIAGVTEETLDTGGVITTTHLGVLASLATKMGDVLSYDDEGNTLTYSPCILGVKEYETPRGNRAYKPYPTKAEQLEHIADGVDWQPYTQVRTQVSRQYSRGA